MEPSSRAGGLATSSSVEGILAWVDEEVRRFVLPPDF